MAKLPTATDVSNARRQAAAALEQARTPLYAVLGAGELASEAVREYVTKARDEAGGQTRDVQARVGDLQARLVELQDRLQEVRGQVRARVGELPDEVAGLRGRLETGELRHALETYAQSLHEVYERLATRGEAAMARLREKPRVRQAIDRVEEAADTTEERVGRFVEDARVLVADVLGLAGRRAHPSDLRAAGIAGIGDGGNGSDGGSGARHVGQAPAGSDAPAGSGAGGSAVTGAPAASTAAAASVAEGAAVAKGATGSHDVTEAGGAGAPKASHHNGASTRGVPAKAGRVQPSRGTTGRKPSSPRKTGGSG